MAFWLMFSENSRTSQKFCAFFVCGVNSPVKVGYKIFWNVLMCALEIIDCVREIILDIMLRVVSVEEFNAQN